MSHDTEALRALVAKMKLRFSSGNSVPVQRAHINDDEWAILLPALERLLAFPDAHPAPSVATEDAGDAVAYKTALAKINCIRNSIIGMQGFRFSMHAYPLVAALNAAGFEGMSYEDAKAYHTKLRETMKNPGDEIPDIAHPIAKPSEDAIMAAALGESAVEALAKEFAEAIDFTAGPQEARDVFRELFRKHLGERQK